jgi:hypothetical protein
VISAEFETDGGGDIVVRIICPFPLNNNGLFMDDWRIEQLRWPVAIVNRWRPPALMKSLQFQTLFML